MIDQRIFFIEIKITKNDKFFMFLKKKKKKKLEKWKEMKKE